MSAPRRWIRLDVDWEDSGWLDALDGTTAGCWPRLLCLFKRGGVGGKLKAPSPAVLARRWRVSETAVTTLIAAALEDGAITVVGGDWTLLNWAKYQEPDSTNRLRQQAFRDKQKTGKKWSAGLSCQVCGAKKDLTRDHVIPHSHGGTDDPENIRVLCRSCNSSRRNNMGWDDDVTRYSAVTGAGPAVTRHATETVTLTLDQKTTSTTAVEVEFQKAWDSYPKRSGGNPRKLALEAFCARVKEGIDPKALIEATGRYRLFCDEGGVSDNKFVMQGATFFGPKERWKDEYHTNGNGPRTHAQPKLHNLVWGDK